MNTKFNIRFISLWLLTIFTFVLLSPKWLFSPAAWIAPALLIRLVTGYKPLKSFGIIYSVIVTSSLIAGYRVLPFPLIIFVITILITSLQLSIPYFLNILLWKRISGFKKTLILPTAFVLYEFLTSFGGGGTWGSIVYSQVENIYLIQLASVTGMWGISFLIYWFASVLNWVYEENFNWSIIKKPILAVSGIFLVILFLGAMRSNPYFSQPKEVVRIAGITGVNLSPIVTMYEDAFGKELRVDINQITQTSPELQELNKGLAAFIEDPFNAKFDKSRLAMEQLQDSLIELSAREARAGAKIVSWSEALTFTLKPEEQRLIDKGRRLAKENKIHFLLTLAAITPGKIEFGKKFIENKAILISPEGEILNTFFKNKPVPVIEPSVPGNGIVPVTNTPFGKLATSICYDADFPGLMQQTGAKEADILLLPSGDWKEISPSHAQMAMMRAIENGFTLFRTVSGASSIASDCYGRVIARKDFYDKGEKVLVCDLPIHGVRTIYSVIGDTFVYICGAMFLMLFIVSFKKK